MSYALNKAFNMWFTGLPSSGKTTTGKALHGLLLELDLKSILLDGDVMRKGLCSDLGFSAEDRSENNRRIIYVSQLLVENNIPVITTFIAPFKKIRTFAKQTIPNYIEVYVNTSVEECIKRDVKGLYKKALAGELKNLTGIDGTYEQPESPDIILNTVDNTVEENLQQLVGYLVENKFITSST